MGGYDFGDARARMVHRQLARRGIHNERVLEAMGAVPREVFVPRRDRRAAYADRALPIGAGQTISQPYIVALMCQALRLRGQELVLEIGTGSGYSAAVLARLAHHVLSIERLPELAARARAAHADLGIGNVTVITGDGSAGWPLERPYAAIAVNALTAEDPGAFLDQLAPGGRLVVPLREHRGDQLILFTEVDGRFRRVPLAPVRFVPLISGAAHHPPDA